MLLALTLTLLTAQDPPVRPPTPPPEAPPTETPPAGTPTAEARPGRSTPLSTDQLRAAAAVAGLEFTDDELRLMLRTVGRNLRSFERLRERELDNAVPLALSFLPQPPAPAPAAGPADAGAGAERKAGFELALPEVERPADLDQLAFAGIPTLASLVRSKKVSCVELCELFLGRLERADRTLHCVITLTRERALRRARELDGMLARGEWLGPLHGIPFGAKDLLAARGYPTTWGAVPFQQQVLDQDAAVIENLEARGAVLVAKLALGALAWGDVWFGGQTKNPWNPEQGSSGSSAGPAAATAAGALPFALGSETLGSIVSPSARCGCSSLRPTFGVVDTRGAMTLSWSMDKLGPLCRSAEDATIVFAGMLGDRPAVPGYRFDPAEPIEVRGMRVGYLEQAFEGRRGEDDQGVLDELRGLGVELVPIELPDYPVGDMTFVLNCEGAAAFDQLTRSGEDDLLVRQVERAWPNVFRAARLVPAVEYIQAQRLRSLLMRDMAKAIDGIDAYVHPSHGNASLTITNLTGHPSFVAPRGARDDGTPRSISFTGRLYGEAKLLALVRAWQAATDYEERHPKLPD